MDRASFVKITMFAIFRQLGNIYSIEWFCGM